MVRSCLQGHVSIINYSREAQMPSLFTVDATLLYVVIERKGSKTILKERFHELYALSSLVLLYLLGPNIIF